MDNMNGSLFSNLIVWTNKALDSFDQYEYVLPNNLNKSIANAIINR